MDSEKSLNKNLDAYENITAKLKSLGERIVDENESFVVLNSLPHSYKDVKAALKCGRDKIPIDEIISALKAKETKLLQMMKKESQNVEGFFC